MPESIRCLCLLVSFIYNSRYLIKNPRRILSDSNYLLVYLYVYYHDMIYVSHGGTWRQPVIFIYYVNELITTLIRLCSEDVLWLSSKHVSVMVVMIVWFLLIYLYYRITASTHFVVYWYVAILITS